MHRLLSVNVGLPRDVTWNRKTVRTAIWKSPVAGRQRVNKLNVVGDAQADLADHGEQRTAWQRKFGAFWTQLDVKSETAQRGHPLSRFLSTNKWLRGSDLN
jgi:MOSC domain-containing protein YiiM